MTSLIYPTEEDLWDAILSRQSEQILQAYLALTEEDQQAILNHLKRMASEPDWHPEQVSSARVALDLLKELG